MRKRNVQILFRLTEEEAEQLNELVRKSGRSKEAFLRETVKGYRLCEKPDPEFYKMMRELSAIGNRINQLAVKANALGFIDTPMLREEARKWHEFQIEIRKRYLLPRKVSYWRSARYGMCVAGSTTRLTTQKIPKKPPIPNTPKLIYRRWSM